MDKKNFLNNSWSESGNDTTKLIETLEDLDKRTSCIKVNSSDVVVYHVPKIIYKRDPVSKQPVSKEINSQEEIEQNSKIRVNIFAPDPEKLFSYTESGLNVMKAGDIKLNELMKNNYKSEIISDIRNIGTILGIRNRLFLLSDSFDGTLGQRIDMDGRGITSHTLCRDLHIAEMFMNNIDSKVVYREQNGIKKAFAMLGPKYAYIPQSAVIEVIKKLDPAKKLGRIKCYEWEVNNNYTKVIMEFPDKADELAKTYGIKDKLIPGVMILKSDVGYSSLRIIGTWRYKNSISITEEVSRKHSGEFDVDELIKNARIRIFGKYTELPERLCDLMLLDVTDPKWKAYSHEDYIKVNNDRICETIKGAFKTLGVAKAIQVKNEKALLQCVLNEIDPEMSYTAYDICLLLMNIPEKIIGLNKNYKDSITKAVGMAPYIDYKKLISNVPKILLTA